MYKYDTEDVKISSSLTTGYSAVNVKKLVRV